MSDPLFRRSFALYHHAAELYYGLSNAQSHGQDDVVRVGRQP